MMATFMKDLSKTIFSKERENYRQSKDNTLAVSSQDYSMAMDNSLGRMAQFTGETISKV